jgi:hypothetical protein
VARKLTEVLPLLLRRLDDLVIDVRNVHAEPHVVAEEVSHDALDDVEADIRPTQAHTHVLTCFEKALTYLA